MSAALKAVDIRVQPFDWKNPDYPAVFQQRIEALQRIRAEPDCVPVLKQYYKDHPAQFINDWGMISDPRQIERALPAAIPFILFPRQIEFIEWLVDHWLAQRNGLGEKSRDMGVSSLCMALSCTLCLHYDGMGIGFGSRKEEYVDKVGSPKSLFYKGRFFMDNLPREFRGGWVRDKNAPHLRLSFPETGSTISGEAGDNIGRGDRTGIYFVDEAAYLQQAELIEASLSQTTNCRIDVSSVHGMANVFAQKRHAGKTDVFIFDWHDDPRKDEAWYLAQVEKLDATVLAQEVDRDYNASVEGVVIPNAWVRAAIDAHIKLNIKPTGAKCGALDVADEGKDKNAYCGAQGILVDFIEEWSGEGGDIFKTTKRAFAIADNLGHGEFMFDGDGLGAAVRGDARILNEQRPAHLKRLAVTPFRGSEAVVDPLKQDVEGVKNEDYFANRKAQGWWALRSRFWRTYRWVTTGEACDPDTIISLSSGMPRLWQLVAELSQPVAETNGTGKIVVNKAPDGVKSPNLGDAVMMRFSGAIRKPMKINPHVLHRV